MVFDVNKLCAWEHNPDGIRAMQRRVGRLSSVASNLVGGEQTDVYLWEALLKVHPTWRRFAQGIGDCVAWGAEIDATTLIAIESLRGSMEWIAEVATEPIYGGCRVEALGKKRGGRQDGAFGFAAADWLIGKKGTGGLLLRVDYSKETGNKEHDLRKYDKKRAKDWGDYGCGGQSDKGVLDGIAHKAIIENATAVTNIEEGIASLKNWYPYTIASNVGFGDMVRDADGVVKRRGNWGHQMCVWGLRWRSGKPQFRICQSWGDSCSGPDPEIQESVDAILGIKICGDGASELPIVGMNRQAFRRRLILPSDDFPYQAKHDEAWNPISACSWWCTEADMAYILKTGDCWTLSGPTGFEPRTLDPRKAIGDEISKRRRRKRV